MNARAKIDRVTEEPRRCRFPGSEVRDRGAASSPRAASSGCCRRLGEHLCAGRRSRWLRRSLVAIPLGSSRRTRPAAGAGHPGGGGRGPDDSLAGPAGVHDPLAGHRAPSRRSSALFLYSLLPIVRNTATGLARHPGAAARVGRGARACRRGAARPDRAADGVAPILAGIKTAAVINVGTATIGALIGAGGFGQPILTGIRRDDVPMILFEGRHPRGAARAGRAGTVRPGRAVPRAAGLEGVINRRAHVLGLKVTFVSEPARCGSRKADPVGQGQDATPVGASVSSDRMRRDEPTISTRDSVGEPTISREPRIWREADQMPRQGW